MKWQHLVFLQIDPQERYIIPYIATMKMLTSKLQ
jgi:hypothetical protein